MPDALQLLKTRRSVKPMELTGPGPSKPEIETLLAVASRVPDHGKLAPWRFIVFEGDARSVSRRSRRRHARADRVRAQAAGARAAGDRGGPAAPARMSRFRNGSS